jgi:hypothetical protein
VKSDRYSLMLEKNLTHQYSELALKYCYLLITQHCTRIQNKSIYLAAVLSIIVVPSFHASKNNKKNMNNTIVRFVTI